MSSQSHKTFIAKELQIETPSQAGTAGRLTSLIAQDAKANIRALWAGVVNGKGMFQVITDNNQKVAQVLQSSPFKSVKETEVLVVHVDDRAGSCAEVAEILGKAGIDIDYFYTASYNNQPALIITTKNNQRAAELLSQ